MNKLNQLSEKQLVTLYQQNKNAVYFGELYERYYSKVYNYSLKQTNNQAAAYEVTTTFFVNMAQNITDLEQPEQFVDWLFNNIHEACHQTDNVSEATPTTF